MSLAQTQIIGRPERRRSERASLALPLVVRGVSLDTKPFQEEAFTLSVSAHGALVALATTVTLGQALFLRNPQTQEEVGAWVTRFGPPRGGFAQVGVELVQPDVEFWSSGPRTRPTTAENERRAEQQIHVLPGPGENAAPEPTSSGSSGEASQLAIISSRPAAPAAAAPDGLLHALEQTLQQAAEQVVSSAANTRLTAAVNQAAEAIENFGHSRIRQLEERLVQYREDFVTSAREEFLSRLKADIEQTEGHLRNRAGDLLQDGATKAHGDFAERIRGTADQAASQFGQQAQASMSDVRSRIDTAAATLAEAQEKIQVETDRAISEAQQRVESLTAQCKEVYAGCEARLRAFQEELSHSSGQELELFRERLRNILTTLLSSLS